MRIVVTGADGQVGRELAKAAGEQGVEHVSLARRDLDVTDRDAVLGAVSDHGADVLINAAAYTAVDAAEDDVDSAWAVNKVGAGNAAHACTTLGIPLVHVSTDYVFDGLKEGPYSETDRPSPLNVYGATKLAGEQEVRRRAERHLIVRSSWIYSRHGRNFVKTILALAAERPSLSVVADQHGSPTSAAELAGHLVRLAKSSARSDFLGWGTYHCADAGSTSWHGLACAAVELARPLTALRVEKIDPVESSDYPTRARRPRNSTLACEKIERTFGLVRRPWQSALAPVVADLLSPEAP